MTKEIDLEGQLVKAEKEMAQFKKKAKESAEQFKAEIRANAKPGEDTSHAEALVDKLFIPPTGTNFTPKKKKRKKHKR